LSEQRLTINAANVVHEEVDDEVIAIDLGGGSYYSLSGSGPAIWAQLGGGATEAELCATLAARHGAAEQDVRPHVSEFLAKLLENQLVVTVDGEEAGSVAPAAPVDGEAAGEFEPPVFERYTDMKDYFLLDPIHEVDAAGWPKPAA
jgi:hypothetical protein